jgi:hypothetical protein
MNFSNFKLDKAVLEARYPAAYSLWDSAGRLWATVEKKWPTIKNIETNLSKIVFRLDLAESYELGSEINAARIVAHAPRENLDKFRAVVAAYMEVLQSVLQSVLQLQVFERIGSRLQYFMQTKTPEDAEDLMKGRDLVRIPEGTYFSIEPKKIATEGTVSLTGDNVGSRIKPATRKNRSILNHH